MAEQKRVQFELKKDKYVNARGGNSHFLDLYCSKCSEYLALYQKDGQGRLLRLYLDRIFAPTNISFLNLRVNSKAEIPNLKCVKCNTLIGTAMIYERENRFAYRLIFGSFLKKKSKGFYPPLE